MTHTMRKGLRWIIFIICLAIVVYFQRVTGKEGLEILGIAITAKKALLIMLAALAGMLGVLYDYNRDYTHPRRDV
ncbi:hypothetical protein NHG25_01455 [Aerococcaceae bacterium NML191292]|nr:hypothetical protein [Aerococcaceae bacterium NML210727]MCW6654526.1 hypothetical protein [Aerococcaceae bacterium NML201296]MCW6659147.1 hypothetical protein [Aerococcaceae bacterium NML191292]MCW6661199.1 hypothetical protein [Aerococcaceae bacterium NML201209]MCW6662477.1 hypothetical protein [Aerococcaceae bacterium NML190073]MCW6664475.1 hypothetical protein [Aerococcaceae bacterium NML191219]MCW6665957.1 hypothetical protein [Aerococcaceae bacterium NML190938]MCW6674212.1 hypothetic